MDIFFTNPNDTPLGPDEIRIRTLEAQPYPDNRRVKVSFEITPFLKRPNFEIFLNNSFGEQVSQFAVVEAIENTMDFTMHIREAKPGGEYTLTMNLYYADIPEPEELADEEDGPLLKDLLIQNKKIIDTRTIRIEIPT